MSEPRVTRRALLGGSLALTVAACGPSRTGPGEEVDADLAAVRDAVREEERLLARYAAVVRRHPTLRSRLEPFSADHRAHLRALRAQVSAAPSPSSTAPATATASTGPPRPTPVASPSSPAEAVEGLAKRERAAATARIEAIGTVPAFLAQLLASIGASEATHAALLTEPG